MTPIIQVAGVGSGAELDLILGSGVTHVGFALYLDVHEEDLPEADVARLIKRIPIGVVGTWITYLTHPKRILAVAGNLGAQCIQLHADLSDSELSELRRSTGAYLIKSLVIGKSPYPELKARAQAWASSVDAFITDTFDPQTGASGATGKTHDWALSRDLAASLPKPLILAGGLTPANVADAIRTVRPAGVDVHSGVEREGKKAAELLNSFVRESRLGFDYIAKNH